MPRKCEEREAAIHPQVNESVYRSSQKSNLMSHQIVDRNGKELYPGLVVRWTINGLPFEGNIHTVLVSGELKCTGGRWRERDGALGFTTDWIERRVKADQVTVVGWNDPKHQYSWYRPPENDTSTNTESKLDEEGGTPMTEAEPPKSKIEQFTDDLLSHEEIQVHHESASAWLDKQRQSSRRSPRYPVPLLERTEDEVREEIHDNVTESTNTSPFNPAIAVAYVECLTEWLGLADWTKRRDMVLVGLDQVFHQPEGVEPTVQQIGYFGAIAYLAGLGFSSW